MNSKAEAQFVDKHAELIEACVKGQNSAFKKLYEAYAKAMFSICMRILNNTAQSEDILQESFISAFKNIDKFKGEGVSFGSWLKRIVINKSLDHLKKRELNWVSLLDQDVIDEDYEEEEITYNVSQIRDAVQKLPDGFRVIFTLYMFEDYSHKMIAEKLGITESTSKTQLLRARKKLVKILSNKN